MTTGDNAEAGIRLACDCVRQMADGADDKALELLNAADEATAKWAAAYLLSCLRESVGARAKGNPRRLRRALLAAITAAEEDSLTTRVELMIQEEGENHV